jgi:hypothetical protein
MAKTTHEAGAQLKERIERIAQDGLSAAQETVEALVAAYEAQYKHGLKLLKKSTATLKKARNGEVREHALELVDAAVTAARQSADTWIELAEHSLGRVRRVVRTAIDNLAA